MVFYKIEVERSESECEEKEISRQEARARAAKLTEKSEQLFRKVHEQAMVFAVTINNEEIVLGAISKTNDSIKPLINKFLAALTIPVKSFTSEEITFSLFESLLRCAERNGYISEDETVLENFEIKSLHSRYNNFHFGESIIDKNQSMEELKETASTLLFSSTVEPELERIYAGNHNIKAIGHPVHYMLTTDDRDTRKTIYKTILTALYNNGRLKNKRYAYMDFDGESSFPDASIEALYRASEGGAVVVRYTNSDETEEMFARRSTDIIAAFCEFAVKYKNSVLTVICLPSNTKKIKENFMLNWNNAAFIELYEDITFKDDAEKYLKNKAREQKVRSDAKLIGKLEDNKGYTASELNRIFDSWYTNKLKNEIYPQYKPIKAVKSKIASETPKGSAYEKLEKLIGLESAKSVMNNALNFFKAQKLFADRGMTGERPSMHMVFTGNPGTAKTTVARLFAEIMKENGLLEKGDMYEVGRADLVGKYVGSTAPLVKSVFKHAKGGVLFIDEAYSLVDDRDGLFGDEAINTIVQEMENNRKDTIVIFAGYTDKMKGFLDKNPGLRSRIAFHIPFDDYSATELCDIAKLIASEKKLTLSSDALIKLENVFETARQDDDFGNGRFARNIIEKAKMSQANRLMKMDFEKITDEELTTIKAEDIEIMKPKTQEKVIKIGFTA